MMANSVTRNWRPAIRITNMRFQVALVTVAIFASRMLAQTSASVTVPQFVKAGEQVEITGRLSPISNFGGTIQWSLASDDGFAMNESSILHGDGTFTISYVIPYAAKSGIWKVASLAFYDGLRPTPLAFAPTTFRVIGNEGLVYPQSAELSLKPSQVQLLRSEVLRLQTRIQDLKSDVKTSSIETLKPLLIQRLESGISETVETQTKYERLSPQSPKSGQREFFEDIRTSYALVLENLTSKGTVKPIAYSPANSREFISGVQSTLRAMEHNELAYEAAIGNESLFFDLEVQSLPSGGRVSYGLRGDKNFTSAQDATNTTIKSLTLAIWIIRVEAPGFEPMEKEHNAISEPYHVVYFPLKALASKK